MISEHHGHLFGTENIGSKCDNSRDVIEVAATSGLSACPRFHWMKDNF